ncbi:TIGR02281 family clan AA aspartic protease [Halioxenophilus sp. WMMB6]|uniref:retropepsin-like aspartic protease family protein n=1 Tax=Halioxenophilus sp. WMMB6 TaxID=3073815 RepID=UPI00295EEF14|nr:TIGR02281 family clan AA aspartic protease [Halioxenophilus sp. WMMB6]
MHRCLRAICLVYLALSAAAWSAADVQVQGLFANSALLTINGQQRLLKTGQSSPEGVKLISANSRECLVEIDGERHQLGISQRIASGFQAAETVEVRIPAGNGGHYYTAGQINGHPVQFLVDTGATSIAMNRSTAEALGINYRSGKQAMARTAGGVKPIFLITLARVSVGALVVDNVEASVHLDDSLGVLLLGNSFLSQLEMKKENGVLVLSAQH